MKTNRLPIACLLLWLATQNTATVFGQTDQLQLRNSSADDRIAGEFLRLSPYQGNPVFSALGNGTWEEKIRERGWILWDTDHYKLYYTGYDGTREGQKKLGLATSQDGISWMRHDRNPIYDNDWVEDMMVVKHDGKYWMFAEGANDQSQLLESDNGIDWRRQGTIKIRRASDGEPIEPGPFGTPTAIVVDGVWNLFYERRDQGVWLARSTDLKTWTNVQDEPVIELGKSGFDTRLIALNQVFRWGEQYVALYHGTSSADKPRLWACGIAVSSNLRDWKRIENNPILPEKLNLSSGIFVFRPSSSLRFYTMHDTVNLFETQSRLDRTATRFETSDRNP